MLDSYKENKKLYDKTLETLRKKPYDFHGAVLDLGYKFSDDSNVDEDKIEEEQAIPQNDNDRVLETYFLQEKAPSYDVIKAFVEEQTSENCNYPLHRKFFKKYTVQALNLLKFGLDEDPLNFVLLKALGILSNFDNVLQEVIRYNTRALSLTNDLKNFRNIAEDYCLWPLNGYEPIPELKKQFADNKHKLDIIISIEKDASVGIPLV